MGRKRKPKGWWSAVFGGGAFEPPVNQGGAHEVTVQPIRLENDAGKRVLIGAFLVLIVPLLFIPSGIGVISYDYTREFRSTSRLGQYLLLLVGQIGVALKALVGTDLPLIGAALPDPRGPLTRAFIGIGVATADAIALWLIISGTRKAVKNKGDLDDFLTEYPNVSVLQSVPVAKQIETA